MHLHAVVTHKKTAVASQARLKLVLLTPYLLFGDEVQPVGLTVNDEALEREFGRQVFRPAGPILGQQLVR